MKKCCLLSEATTPSQNLGPACRDGYELIPGDIPGHGEFGSNGKFSNIESTDARGQLCADLRHCKSYEYSLHEKKCYLNRKIKPSVGIYGDFSFCAVKGKGSIVTDRKQS